MSAGLRYTQEQLDDLLRRRGRIAAAVPVAPALEVANDAQSKHLNIRTKVDGFNFDSRLEARYYKQLMTEWRCDEGRLSAPNDDLFKAWLSVQGRVGAISWFTRQVPFWLEGGVKLVVDFEVVRVVPNTAQIVAVEIVDTKGRITQTAINKIKQAESRYPFHVKLIKSADIWPGITL